MYCQFCDLGFAEKRSLIRHLLDVHGVTLEEKSDTTETVEVDSCCDCCSICGENHETESCVTFGTIQIINDTFTLSRARLTLPQGLSVDNRVDGSTAVIAKRKFSIGVRFGPFVARTSTTLSPKINFPLKLFDIDATWDDESGCIKYSDVFLETDDEDCCNWMCLVSAATSASEQNLFCFQMRKELYYLVIKEINEGDELKVWYAPYYAKRMCSDTLVRLSASSEVHKKAVSSRPGVTGGKVSSQHLSDAFYDDTDARDISDYDPPTKVHAKVSCSNPTNNDNSNGVSNADHHLKNHVFSVVDRKLINNNKDMKVGRRRISVHQPNIQSSYLLCFDSSGNPRIVEWNYVSNNDSRLDHSQLPPLLLGARQLKNKWKCSVCGHVEHNVASHAKHLMSHYKHEFDENSADIGLYTKPAFRKVCSCGVVLKTRKKLEEHSKVCSQLQLDKDCALKASTSDNGVVILNGNCNQNERQLLPASSGLVNSTNTRSNDSNGNNCDSYGEQCENVSVNDKSLPPFQQPGIIMDFTVNIDNDFVLTNDYCGKETDFQCFSFSDPLTSIDEEVSKEKDFREGENCNISIGKESAANYFNSSAQSCVADNGGASLKHNGQVKLVSSDIQKVSEESDCLLNAVGNVPPILDLTDDEIIVFQSIKNFSQIGNINCVSESSNDAEKAAAHGNKDMVVSTSYCKYKPSYEIGASVNVDNCENIYHMDYQGSTNLAPDSFSLEGQPVNYVDGKTENNDVTDSSRSLLNKNDVINNLLHDTSTSAMNNRNFISNGDDVATVNINKSGVEDCVSDNRNSNADVNGNGSISAAGGSQDHQLSKSISAALCDENNLFVDNGEICGFDEKENNDITKVPLKEFNCDICGKKFSRSWYLYRHLRKHTGEFTCNFCLAVFARKENLVNHSCAASKHFVSLLKKTGRLCNLCGQVFRNKTQFRNHVSDCSVSAFQSASEVNGADKAICIYCSKSCNFSELKEHVDACLKNPKGTRVMSRTLLCDKCGTVCGSKRSLNLHLATHDSGRYCCPFCEKKYNRNDKLQHHLLTHQPESQCHECHICDKKLKTIKSLRIHMKMHTSAKRFTCDQCTKSFHQKGNLIKHLRSHKREQEQQKQHWPDDDDDDDDGDDDDDDPPPDDAGVVISLNVNNDTSHMTVTTDYDGVSAITIAPAVNGVNSDCSAPADKTYKCNTCSRVFLEERTLKIHIKKVHTLSGNFVCQICDRVLKHKNSLKRHLMRRHSAEKYLPVGENNFSAAIVSTDVDKKDHKSTVFTNPSSGELQMVQDHQSSTTVPGKTATDTRTGSDQSVTVYAFEEDKTISCDLSKTTVSVDDSNVNVTEKFITDGANNGSDICVDKINPSTDYLYCILNPSSLSHVSGVINNDNSDSDFNNISSLR